MFDDICGFNSTNVAMFDPELFAIVSAKNFEELERAMKAVKHWRIEHGLAMQEYYINQQIREKKNKDDWLQQRIIENNF